MNIVDQVRLTTNTVETIGHVKRLAGLVGTVRKILHPNNSSRSVLLVDFPGGNYKANASQFEKAV